MNNHKIDLIKKIINELNKMIVVKKHNLPSFHLEVQIN
jgi:hypothetical protein